MKFEYTEVFNFEGAIRGMRNPMNSWNKSDTKDNEIGEADLKLAQKLIKAGSEHRKFLRQIFISVDITAPLYFWKEFSTYKVGTTSNSCSTMHKLADTPITKECFECPNLLLDSTLWFIEDMRKEYNRSKDKRFWKALICNLPSSWLQRRTITMNYEVVLNMIHQRKNHKLTEWSVDFINWAKSLPYAKELLFIEETKNEKNEKNND